MRHKTQILSLIFLLVGTLVLASGGKNPKEAAKAEESGEIETISSIDPKEKKEQDAGETTEDLQSETPIDYFQNLSYFEPDTSMNSVSKYNFLFYFIYKYKYEKEVTDFEELRALSTH